MGWSGLKQTISTDSFVGICKVRSHPFGNYCYEEQNHTVTLEELSYNRF